MKFVTLALATLLAVGCRAASLQADAPALPTYLEHARSGMRMTLDNMKAALDRIAENIKTEMNEPETGDMIKARTEAIYQYLLALQVNAAPVTDGIVGTIDDATREWRNNIYGDIEALKKDLDPKMEALRAVLEAHMNEYRKIVETFRENNQAEYQKQMDEWKTKVGPIIDDLRTKFNTNVEETRSKLVPIVEAIRAKINQRMEEVRTALEPYANEYREQLKQAYSQAQSVDVDAMKKKLEPHFDTLKANFEALFNELKEMAGQGQQ